MRHTGDTVIFMAWHTVKDTLKLTGRSRSQLYRDMKKGLVSYRFLSPVCYLNGLNDVKAER
jgi:hypothetical protein